MLIKTVNPPFSPFPSRELKRLDFQAKNGEWTGLIVLLHFLPWEERERKKGKRINFALFPKENFKQTRLLFKLLHNLSITWKALLCSFVHFPLYMS